MVSKWVGRRLVGIPVYTPFPLTVTGVMDEARFCTFSVGVATAEATRARATAKVFMMVVCELMIITGWATVWLMQETINGAIMQVEIAWQASEPRRRSQGEWQLPVKRV